MRSALESIARILSGGAHNAGTLPWAELRYQHTAALRSVLAERYAPATANRHLAALRGVLQECWRLGQMPVEDYQRAVDLRPIRGNSPPKGRSLGGPEIQRLLAACAGDDLRGRRDAALIAALYVGGLRRAEAVALDVGDYDAGAGSLLVRAGKGQKARVVYVDAAAARLAGWLHVRGSLPGPLFYPVNRLGRIVPRRLTPQAVAFILQGRARQVGLTHFTPHDLRRTFVGDLLDAGVDLPTVQAMAGHANVTTTARYDRRGERAKRRAASLLNL